MSENQGNFPNPSTIDNLIFIKAKEELGETDEIKKESILVIQDWLRTEEKGYPLGISLRFHQILLNNNKFAKKRRYLYSGSFVDPNMTLKELKTILKTSSHFASKLKNGTVAVIL